MPIISAFFGIVIRMYYKEHGPAHFHAEYAGQQAKFDFGGALVAGEIRSSKARTRIRDWARQHRLLGVLWRVSSRCGRADHEILTIHRARGAPRRVSASRRL